MNLFFHNTPGSLYSLFPKSLRHEKLFFHSLNMAKPATFFANFPVNKYPPTSEVIRRCRSIYEGCDLVPLVTTSIGDSELIKLFQEAYARLFPNCYYISNQSRFNQSREIIVDWFHLESLWCCYNYLKDP